VTPQPNAAPTPARSFDWRGHRIAWWSEGDGPALVLVHSIHAAASRDEWLQVIPSLGRHFRVITLDLLGFGASDRPPIEYTAEGYLELLRDFLREAVAEPAVLVGSSLGGSYAVALAARHPELVRSVIAVGPAGVTRLVGSGNAATRAIAAAFRSGVPGRALFGILVSRVSMRQFLRGIYSDPALLTEALVDRYWRTAQHPNARFAPAAFVGQALNCDLRDALRAVRVPLALFWGERATQTPIAEAQAFRLIRRDTVYRPLPGGDLPHDEQPERFVEALLQFLAYQARRAA
jgi:pimeloyl-ACP methyl ester carboxylesterase